MPLIEWQASYDVGIDLIDSDHRLLVSLINQLNDAMQANEGPDVVGSVLNVLVEYTETHFGREELVMEKGGYPELAPHKREHEKLCEQVHAIVSRYSAGESEAVDQEVLQFLKTWLTGHILGVDMKYKPYCENVELTPEELLQSFRLDEFEDDDDPRTSPDPFSTH